MPGSDAADGRGVAVGRRHGGAEPSATGDPAIAIRRPLIAVLAAIGVVKAALLIAAGAFFLPDSVTYSTYADVILDHGRALAPLVGDFPVTSPLVFRPAGYPLVLAAAKLVSPGGYTSATVVFQCLVDGIAICLMLAVSLRLLRSTGAALAAVLLYAGSTSLLWDNAILSDSLYASLWNIVVFALLGHLLGCWRLGIPRSLGLGLLWGASLWVRDVGIYFTFLPLALLVWIAAREAWRRPALLRLAAFLLATGGMASGMVALNYHRTGDAYFSVTGVENWLRPVFDIAEAGYAQPFADDSLISTTVRETMTDYGFDSQLRFLDVLQQRCVCTPARINAMVAAKYRATVIRYPVAYARVVLRNFNYFALGELIADPLATVNQLLELGTVTPGLRIPGLSLRNLKELSRHFALGPLALMLLSAAAELVSAIAFTAFLFGTPYLLLRAWRRRVLGIEACATGFLWSSFVGVSLAFSLVHFEARHALPILPAAAIGLVWVMSRWFSRRCTASA